MVSHAVKRGYYQSDSEVTLRELADELGMARSTLGEHLQREEEEIKKMAAEDIG